jgi:hypothetical protein
MAVKMKKKREMRKTRMQNTPKKLEDENHANEAKKGGAH